MWGTLSSIADKAREAADKAREAAEKIEGQLNESVGVEPGSTADSGSQQLTPQPSALGTVGDGGDDLGYDDDDFAWEETPSATPASAHRPSAAASTAPVAPPLFQDDDGEETPPPAAAAAAPAARETVVALPPPKPKPVQQETVVSLPPPKQSAPAPAPEPAPAPVPAPEPESMAQDGWAEDDDGMPGFDDDEMPGFDDVAIEEQQQEPQQGREQEQQPKEKGEGGGKKEHQPPPRPAAAAGAPAPAAAVEAEAKVEAGGDNDNDVAAAAVGGSEGWAANDSIDDDIDDMYDDDDDDVDGAEAVADGGATKEESVAAAAPPPIQQEQPPRAPSQEPEPKPDSVRKLDEMMRSEYLDPEEIKRVEALAAADAALKEEKARAPPAAREEEDEVPVEMQDEVATGAMEESAPAQEAEGAGTVVDLPPPPVTAEEPSAEAAVEAEAQPPLSQQPQPSASSTAPATPAPPAQADDGAAVEAMNRLREEHEMTLALLQSQLTDVETRLTQRESQLTDQAQQMAQIQNLHETELNDLRSKLHDTKEEAKRRIGKARERVEDMQSKLKLAEQRAGLVDSDASEKDAIIAALRNEGEQLARKQGTLEQAVRSAKAESRELAERLQTEASQKEDALAKITVLESTLQSTKNELNAARKGESRSSQLEHDLVASREESEKQKSINLGLEQQIRELKDVTKSLRADAEDAKRGLQLEKEEESKTLKRERDDMLSDLETKLRTSEREANVREDALRHEVGELRKRWQDAVRRADALSMDVQQSTAPLMRQLESTERQHRARAAAWAELETKLRSDLEGHVIQNEKLTKERTELKTDKKRLDRIASEREEELATARETIEDLTATVDRLETKVDELEREGRKIKEEWVQVERQASEGVAKVRSDMMKTVVDSEERYRSQIESLEAELRTERDTRVGLETRLEALVESTGMMELAATTSSSSRSPEVVKEKKLRSTTDQVSILQSTLGGLGDDDDESEGEKSDLDEESSSADITNGDAGLSGSFAAMEQLSQGLKSAKLELDDLRKQLASSEETRESLVAELAETRQAAEKLPLFEAKVAELTREVQEKDFEIQGLRDDISDVRTMYRSQLDALLEEKAATTPLVERKTVSEDESDPAPENTSEDAFASYPNEVAAADFDIGSK